MCCPGKQSLTLSACYADPCCALCCQQPACVQRPAWPDQKPQGVCTSPSTSVPCPVQPKQQRLTLQGSQHLRVDAPAYSSLWVPGSQHSTAQAQRNQLTGELLRPLLLLQARAVVVDMEEGVINHMLKVRAAVAVRQACLCCTQQTPFSDRHLLSS